MQSTLRKVVGVSALGAVSIAELFHLQLASATPVNFTGSVYSNPRGGSVQVAVTVDGASGVYRITSISTPIQPTGQNSSYASYAIPTLTSEALAAQSAAINGVSGASEISAAWKASLSSAIAAAAAANQTVGQPSVAPSPTPTAGAPTPSAGGPTPTTTHGSTVAPVSTVIPTSVGIAPTYYPLNLPPYGSTTSTGTGPNLSSYLSQISTILSLLARNGGEGSSTSLNNARNALSTLQAQVLADSNQTQTSTSSASLTSYVSNMNAQVTYVMAQANQAIADYYAKVQLASNQLYVDAQASAAAVSASPAPTVTVTVTATPTPIITPPPLVFKPAGVIKKTFTCVKTVSGKTTSKVIKAVIVKCPTGFKLLKKK